METTSSPIQRMFTSHDIGMTFVCIRNRLCENRRPIFHSACSNLVPKKTVIIVAHAWWGWPLSMAKRSLYAKSFFSTFIRHLVLASSKCCVVWYNNSCQSSPRARLSFSMFHARTRMICSSIADRSNSERESNRLMCMSHGSINSARRTTTATNRPPHHQNTER